MKKLSLLKLNDPKVLREEELRKVKGGNCLAWSCECNDGWADYKNGSLIVDNTLENRNQNGYL